MHRPINSWEKCSDLCYLDSTCNFWALNNNVWNSNGTGVDKCFLLTEKSNEINNGGWTSGSRPVADPNNYKIKVTPTELQTTTGYTLRASTAPNDTCVSLGGMDTISPTTRCCPNTCGPNCDDDDINCGVGGEGCCFAEATGRICGEDALPCHIDPVVNEIDQNFNLAVRGCDLTDYNFE